MVNFFSNKEVLIDGRKEGAEHASYLLGISNLGRKREVGLPHSLNRALVTQRQFTPEVASTVSRCLDLHTLVLLIRLDAG